MSHRIRRFVEEQIGVLYKIETGHEPGISSMVGSGTLSETLFTGRGDDPSVKVIILVEPENRMPLLGAGTKPDHEAFEEERVKYPPLPPGHPDYREDMLHGR
jgi:hypothetical protein